jgi:hypothetical protein
MKYRSHVARMKALLATPVPHGAWARALVLRVARAWMLRPCVAPTEAAMPCVAWAGGHQGRAWHFDSLWSTYK